MSYGRREILTDAVAITANNVIEEVRAALAVHDRNRSEIIKLHNHFKGKTAVLNKKKEVRPEINYQINENHAYEIVNFHRGYNFGKPIQYVRRENAYSELPDDVIAKDINALNCYMTDAGKDACNHEMAEWMLVAGLGHRLTLPNPQWRKDNDESPLCLYSLSPANSFVVKSSSVRRTPMMGVHYIERRDGRKVFSVYTKDCYYEFVDHESELYVKPHALGMIPIVEYPADPSRLGVFETVMDLLDALNDLQSNRMDDIVQFVNSFLAILGGELDDATYKKLNEWKTLCLPAGVDAKYLSPAMSQSDVQTLKNDFYQAILTVCAVPNRNGGSSTSDTGQAVELRDGWAAAESKAKGLETMFERSEKESLKIALRILRDTVGTNLKLSDIKPHFTRRNYENIATKAQVLISMLNNPWIHPEVAYASCGMFPDSESAYLQGKAWKEEQEKKEAKRNADLGAGALSGVQPATGEPKGASADQVS